VIRQPALQSLSRDHHQALAIALKLARSDADTAAGAQDAFLRYWLGHGRDHFRAEEEILLPTFANHADPQHPLVARVLREHLLIRRRAIRIERGAEEPLWRLRELGALVSDHVRLEERELFPLVEARLSSDELAWLAGALERAESSADE
jgi:hypothetical protein